MARISPYYNAGEPATPIRPQLNTGLAGNAAASNFPTAAPPPSVGPASDADPYAALRRIPKQYLQPNLVNRVIQQNGDYAGDPIYETNPDGSRKEFQEGYSFTPEAFQAGSPLAPFQSKFNYAMDNGDGRHTFNFQDPGQDKYGLTKGVYRIDPATGDFVLEGDLNNFRQQSSLTGALQGAGQVASFVGGGALAGPLAGAMGGGILGGAAAGATVGGGGALISGGNSQQAGQAALLGGLAGGANAAMQGQGWTNPSQRPNFSGFLRGETAALDPNQIGALNTPANAAANPIDDFYFGGGLATDASAGNFGTGFADAALPPGFTPSQTITITGARVLPGAGASVTGGLTGGLAGALMPEQLSPGISTPDPQQPMPEQETPIGGGLGEFFKGNPIAAIGAGQAAAELLGRGDPAMPAAPGSSGPSGPGVPSQQSIIDALLKNLYGNGHTGPDYSQVPGLVSNAGSYNQFSQEAADAAYNQQTRYLDPQIRQQQQALEARLSEQGFVPGTPGYDRAMQNFMDTNARAYAQARDTATLQGFDVGKNFFQNSLSNANLNNQSAAQKMAELLAQRSQPFNELASWQNREQVQYGNALDKYNADVASSNSNKQAIGQLIAGLGMYFSDARLKEDIVQIGSTPAGVPFYEYTIFGRREKGVLAQELAITQPEAVSQHESGYLIVDYRKVR